MLDIDVKLMAIFEEIYRTRSVSQAAENMRLSQPTISIGLGKLRRRFNDPLFVARRGEWNRLRLLPNC
jgi:DNA-binding transcriptional LysR family regulator